MIRISGSAPLGETGLLWESGRSDQGRVGNDGEATGAKEKG